MSSRQPVSPGRIVAVDYGTVRIGTAITDPDQAFATPLDNYVRRGADQDARYFKEMVSREQPVLFVVGLPLHLSGDESPKSREARRFGEWLHALTQVPVKYFDERFTSTEAAQLLSGAGLSKKKRQDRLDMLAAQILLSAYLESADHLQPGSPSPASPLAD